MLKKQVYLLSKASSYELEVITEHYNEEQSINVTVIDGEEYPLISQEMNIPTESKTLKAPGDDDPDPEDERCY